MTALQFLKRSSLILALSFLPFSSQANVCSSQWQTISPTLPPLATVTDITTDTTQVLALTDQGSVLRYVSADEWQTLSELPLVSPEMFYGGNLIWTGERWLTSDAQELFSSSDGITWQAITGLPSNYNYQLVYNNSVYLAFSDQVFISTDLNTWQAVNLPEQYQITDIDWTGERFLAVAREDVPVNGSTLPFDRLLSSSDGSTWQVEHQFNAQLGLRDIVRNAANQEVILGSIGDEAYLVQYANNNWQITDLPNELDNFSQIAWNGHQFLAVPQVLQTEQYGLVYYSDDGMQWTTVDTQMPASFNKPMPNPLGGWFLSSGSLLLSSPDGQTWQTPNHLTIADLTHVVSNGQQFVVTGQFDTGYILDGTTYYGELLFSTDGQTWQTQLTETLPKALIWDGQRYLMLGLRTLTDNSLQLWVHTSSDGQTWQAQPALNPVVDVTSLAFNGSTYVAAGNATENTSFLYSIDGLNWQASPSNLHSEKIQQIIWTGSEFFALDDKNRYTSTDGQTWQVADNVLVAGVENGVTSPNPFAIPTVTVNSLVFNGQFWVAGGNVSEHRAASGSALWTSSDGQTWQRLETSDLNVSVRAITWAGEQFIAVSSLSGAYPNRSYVYTSSDGLTWQKQDSELAPLNSLLVHQDQVLAVGNLGYVVASNCNAENEPVTEPSEEVAEATPSAPEAVCTDNDCYYNITLDQAGFYIATVNLPAGASQGFWGLSVNTTGGHNVGGFNAGAILKENGETPSFIGFYLSESEALTLTGYEYTGAVDNLYISIKHDDEKDNYVFEPTLIQSGESKTTDVLTAGFYVLEMFSESGAARGRSGISINGQAFQTGVNIGGWIDNTTGGNGEGFGAFYVETPQTVNLKLLFGDNYGEVGAAKPVLSLYRQTEEEVRELVYQFE